MVVVKDGSQWIATYRERRVVASNRCDAVRICYDLIVRGYL